MLSAHCNLCLTIRCSSKIFFMLGAHGNLRLTIRWSFKVFFFILVAHGNLCLAIRWSLKIHWYIGCPWQPMPGLHFARFCFKLPQQILLISWPIGQLPVNFIKIGPQTPKLWPKRCPLVAKKRFGSLVAKPNSKSTVRILNLNTHYHIKAFWKGWKKAIKSWKISTFDYKTQRP